MWEPRRLTTLWASTSCYRDSFTLLLPFNVRQFAAMVTWNCVITMANHVLREPFICCYEMWAYSCPLKFGFPSCTVRVGPKVKAEKSTHHVSLKHMANRTSSYSGLQDVQDLFLPRTAAGPQAVLYKQTLWPAEPLPWQRATLFVLKSSGI
jgi:hypothetical protein